MVKFSQTMRELDGRGRVFLVLTSAISRLSFHKRNLSWKCRFSSKKGKKTWV